MEKKMKISEPLGLTTILFTCESFAGEPSDTEVYIGETHLCNISSKDFRKFITELSDLINKYEI